MSPEEKYIENVTRVTKEILFSQDKEFMRQISLSLLALNRKATMEYLDLQQKFIALVKIAEDQAISLKNLQPKK